MFVNEHVFLILVLHRLRTMTSYLTTYLTSTRSKGVWGRKDVDSYTTDNLLQGKG